MCDDVLRYAGPVGIWLWPITAVGQVLVALVVAQFAARIPLSGSSYQWASRLANPRIGWGFGWLTFWYLAIAVVAVDNALASQSLMPLAGIKPDEATARVITLVVLLIQALLAVASTRIVSMINGSAVGLELVLVVVVTRRSTPNPETSASRREVRGQTSVSASAASRTLKLRSSGVARR